MTTDILLLVPLMVACALTVALVVSEADRKWKIVSATAVAASLAMRFVPGIPVPFIIPFVIEGIASIALAIWLKQQYF